MTDDSATDGRDETAEDTDSTDEGTDDEDSPNEEVSDGSESTEGTDLAFPPGTSDAGIDDPNELLSAHLDRIQEVAFEFTVQIETPVGTAAPETTYTGRYDQERRRYRGQQIGAEERLELYQDAHNRFVRENGTVSRDEPDDDLWQHFWMEGELPAEMIGDTLAFEYGGIRSEETDRIHEFTPIANAGGGEIDSPDGRLFVHDDGLLRYCHVEFQQPEGHTEVEWEFSEIGTATVQPPTWAE